MEPVGLEESAILLCSELDKSSPHPLSDFLEIHFNIILISTPRFSKCSLSLRKTIKLYVETSDQLEGRCIYLFFCGSFNNPIRMAG
jgi:hypothetical protein